MSYIELLITAAFPAKGSGCGHSDYVQGSMHKLHVGSVRSPDLATY